MSAVSRAIAAAGGPTEVAKVLEVSVQAVCFWRDGKRSFPPEYCAPIELACGGVVTRRDLRPNDWWVIWPELVTDEHPIPQLAHQA
jgi:DNA-binding transcriptional regulator YdaS (Cro superfamily)